MYLAFQAIHSPDEGSMNLAFKMMNCVSKMMKSAFKMTDFAPVPQSYQDKFLTTIPDTEEPSKGCGPGMIGPGQTCNVGREYK